MDYALAITITVGAVTVAYWLWRTCRRTRSSRKTKSDKHTPSASEAGESTENPAHQLQSSVVKPTVNTNPQPHMAMATSSTDGKASSSALDGSDQMQESQFVSAAPASTEPSVAAEESEHPASTATLQPPVLTDMTASGTDENVRSSAPVSSEQISVSEMDESQFVSQAATTTEPSAAAEESEHPASTPTQPPVLTAEAAAAAIMDVDWDFIPELELEELKNAHSLGGVEAVTTLLERKRDAWKEIPLKVAVIGISGSGKSSFINAIRRLTADDEGGAPVDVKETTVDIRSYPHPSNPLLKFWDLPGVGTDHFPKETYLSDIEVEYFDFFLLITADRFRENDTWLGKEFRKRNKKYFFVRTKVGADIVNNEKAHPKTHNEHDVVRTIRESTEEHLKENGFEDVPMFLIDSYQLTEFDFEQLEGRLIKDFPKMKKAALVLSLQSTSKEMISVKVAELRSRMWKRAALSSVVAAAPGEKLPVLGLSIMMNIGMIEAAEFYFTQLGLDERSLERYAKLTNTDYRKLNSIVYSYLGCTSVEGMRQFVEEITKHNPAVVISSVVAEVSRFIPRIGPLIAAPTSFGGTFYAMKLVLHKMESVALKVVQCAAEN